MAYLRDYFLELRDFRDRIRHHDAHGFFRMRYFSPAELDRLGCAEKVRDGAVFHCETATFAAASPPRHVAVALPAIRKVDEAYRTVVFMPGAYHPGQDYFAESISGRSIYLGFAR